MLQTILTIFFNISSHWSLYPELKGKNERGGIDRIIYPISEGKSEIG